MELNTPAVLNVCNRLTMNFASSKGSGNRDWTSTVFTVTGSNTTSAALMQTYLAQMTSFSPPIVVPASRLVPGFYNIQLELCNFLGACGQSTAFVAVTSTLIPSVGISGSLLRTVSRQQGLEIVASSFVSDCAGATAKTNLLNSWSVLKNNVLDVDVRTDSKSSTVFKLDAYTLSVSAAYTIKFSSQYLVSQRTSQISVQVYVAPGNLVAVLKRSGSFSIRQGQNTTLDASGSFDDDVRPALRTATGLTFAWSCIRTLPTVNENCSFAFDNTMQSTPFLNVFAEIGSIGTTSSFTVTVSDAARSSTATATVSVLALTKPVVRLSSPYTGKFNTFDKLKLSGSIETKSTVTAVWSVNDTSVSLAEFLQTPISTTLTLPTSNTVDTSFAYNLAMKPNALPVNTYLTFTLTTTLVNGDSVASSLVVITNSAPTPGIFSVDPILGVALTDPFVFAASLWQDDDLPLTYAFGFLSKTVSAAFQALQPRSELTYGTYLLPVGSDARNYALICAAQIFDSYEVNTTSLVQVQVTVASTTALQGYITSQLTSTTEPDVVQQVLSTASAALNTVNCKLANKCPDVNRFECSRVKNTCGSCYEGFLGDDGDGNTMCYDAENLRSRKLEQTNLRSAATETYARTGRLLAGRTCHGDRFCPSFQYCDPDTFTCYSPNKECPFDCSGQGTCKFFKLPVSSAVEVEECLLTDFNCVPRCVCTSEWAGASCAVNATEMRAATTSRTTLLANLYNLTQHQDASVATVSSWVSTLTALSFQQEELSYDSIRSIQRILGYILDSAKEIALPSEVLKPLLDTLNVIFPLVTSKASLQTGFPLKTTAELVQISKDFIATQTTLLHEVITLILEDSVSGENVYSNVQGGDVRVNVYSVNSYTLDDSTLSAIVAKTPLEKNFGADTFDAAFQSIASGVDVSLSLLQLQYSKMLTDALLLNTHPVLLQLQDSDSVCSQAGNTCEFVFDMFNIDEQEYVVEYPYNETFTTYCKNDGVPSQATYTCPNDAEVTAECPGNFTGYITTTCPYVDIRPSCGLLIDYELVTDNCRATEFDATYTRCACNISADAFATSTSDRRRMSSSSSSSGAEVSSTTTETSVDSTSTTTTTIPPVPPPPFSILGVRTQGLWIIFGSVVGFILLSAAIYLYMHWGVIMDTDSQYDEVDYVIYAKLLRTSIGELLEVNREAREKLLFAPLQMEFAVKHLIAQGSSKGKICRDEVDDLLYVQKAIEEENEKLPYWQFVLTSEVEVEGQATTDDHEAGEGRFERLMTQFRGQLLDAAGPLALPIHAEIKEDPLLVRQKSLSPKRQFTMKFANSFGMSSPSIFNFESRKIVDDGGNSSPYMGDIYSSRKDDDPFTFTFNRRDISRTAAPHSHTGVFSRGNPVSPFRENSGDRADSFAININDDFGRADSPTGLYEAVSFRSFHMGNSARSEENGDGALGAGDIYFRRNEEEPVYYSNNLRGRTMSPTERSIQAGTFGLSDAEQDTQRDRRRFFAEEIDYDQLLSEGQAYPAPSSQPSMHSTSPAERTYMSTPPPTLGAGTATSTNRSMSAGRGARSERWSNMLDRVKRRSQGDFSDAALAAAAAESRTPSGGVGTPQPERLIVQTGHSGQTAYFSAQSSPSTDSAEVPNVPLPYPMRTRTSRPSLSGPTPVNLVSAPHSTQHSTVDSPAPTEPVQLAGRDTTRVLPRTDSFASVASSSRDTLTTAASLRQDVEAPRTMAPLISNLGTTLETYLSGAGDVEALGVDIENELLEDAAEAQTEAEAQALHTALLEEAEEGKSSSSSEDGDSNAGEDFEVPVRRPHSNFSSPGPVASPSVAEMSAPSYLPPVLLVPRVSKVTASLGSTRSPSPARSPSPVHGGTREISPVPEETPLPLASSTGRFPTNTLFIPTPTPTTTLTRVRKDSAVRATRSSSGDRNLGKEHAGQADLSPIEFASSPTASAFTEAASMRSGKSGAFVEEVPSPALHAPPAVLVPKVSKVTAALANKPTSPPSLSTGAFNSSTHLNSKAERSGGSIASRSSRGESLKSEMESEIFQRQKLSASASRPAPFQQPGAVSQRFETASSTGTDSTARLVARPTPSSTLGARAVNRSISSTASAGYTPEERSPSDMPSPLASPQAQEIIAGGRDSSVKLLAQRYENQSSSNPLLRRAPTGARTTPMAAQGRSPASAPVPTQAPANVVRSRDSYQYAPMSPEELQTMQEQYARPGAPSSARRPLVRPSAPSISTRAVPPSLDTEEGSSVLPPPGPDADLLASRRRADSGASTRSRYTTDL